ncbi:hypothetical protein IMSAGC006_00642 [Muribaculaceae bacterium]|nr:hypothetical protein IMSAGC006_00642 [Muribaculaceae bacterium]
MPSNISIVMIRKFEIRNSTAESLIFQIEGKEEGVRVLYRVRDEYLVHAEGFSTIV